MRRLLLTAVIATVVPAAAAQAEPVTVGLHPSSAAGFKQSVDPSLGWFMIDLGSASMTGADSVGTFFFNGLRHGSDYRVRLHFTNPLPFEALRFEILKPLGSEWDRYDAPGQPSYVPAGYSASNNLDGFSFAQYSALDRSALFAGGASSVAPDEMTHRGDILVFSGIGGAENLRVNFGLRDRIGNRGFLLRITGLGGINAEAAPVPEPASMLLLGTGLAGLAGAYRRRRRLALE